MITQKCNIKVGRLYKYTDTDCEFDFYYFVVSVDSHVKHYWINQPDTIISIHETEAQLLWEEVNA